MDIRVLAYESTTASWSNRSQMANALANNVSGLRANDLPGSDIPTYIGRVGGVEDVELGVWASRNNALAALCLQQGQFRASVEAAVERYGATRVGVIIGTSTSSIDRTETAYQHLTDTGELASEYRQANVHNPHAPGLFVAEYLNLPGPAMTINTACSSSAKVFAAASRWLAAGIVDAVLVGGVDTLCLSVVHGFNALQLVSPERCQPFDRDRDGINIGEAAGFALLAKADCDLQSLPISLIGYGESSDAHHMSHPHPEGRGAYEAMAAALHGAGLEPAQIGYINLHGTASQANDLIEGQVVGQLFPSTTVCSSTKGWTAHTLGAAGITEALICLQTLEQGLAPATLNTQNLDPQVSLNLALSAEPVTSRFAMTNSFGFGGNNCSLVFARESAQ